MAKKRRIPSGQPQSPLAGSGGSPAVSNGKPTTIETPASARPSLNNFGTRGRTAASAASLPQEVVRGDWTVAILALMMFITPGIGVPNELMLQDTLKSMVVAFAAIGAGLIFFWQQRNRRDGLRWHAVMWLPLALMFYALGSMVWSHTYLGGVEAIRWFIFSLILWLGLNTLSRQRTPYLFEGIHWGAFVCSLWTVLQFYFDFTYFPQGPNPASTFVNRNFFAEFVVCTFPFSAYLLAQSKTSSRITLMAFMFAFNIVALLMTGTRGALAAMWILTLFVLPLIGFVCRKQFSFSSWDSGRRILACGVFFATVLTMGLVSSGNPKVISDRLSYGNATTAFDMAFKRTASISTTDGSFGVRLIMWKATLVMIKANPVTALALARGRPSSPCTRWRARSWRLIITFTTKSSSYWQSMG